MKLYIVEDHLIRDLYIQINHKNGFIVKEWINNIYNAYFNKDKNRVKYHKWHNKLKYYL